MPLYQIRIRLLVPISLAKFHPVLFRIALDLAMPEHWKTWHGRHHGADAKVFIFLTKLVDCCTLVRVVHEVYVPFEYLRIKFQRVFDHQSVFLIFFIP